MTIGEKPLVTDCAAQNDSCVVIHIISKKAIHTVPVWNKIVVWRVLSGLFFNVPEENE